LGLAAAVASSFRDRVVDDSTVILGEVGLSGEVRAVTQAERRILEAAKRGFRRVVLPKGNLRNLSLKADIELIGIQSVSEALGLLLS
jgi:DNA repair protein RadA/Sms